MSALSCLRRRTPVLVFANSAGSRSRVAGGDLPVDGAHKVVETGHAFAVSAANLSPQGFIGAKAAIWFIMSEYGRC
jgi:hypothetical protein